MQWAEVWKWRTALLYTVGSWTVFGGIFFYTGVPLRKRRDDAEEEEEQQQQHMLLKSFPDHNEMGSATTIYEDRPRETTVYGSSDGLVSVTSVTRYRPNFVPYSVRLQNFVQSFFDNSGGKEK